MGMNQDPSSTVPLVCAGLGFHITPMALHRDEGVTEKEPCVSPSQSQDPS